MIDTLLIDLDNTILDFNKAEGPALAGALRTMGIEPTEELLSRYSVINLAHWKCLEKGQITMAEVKVSRFRQLFDEFGITISPAETAKVYEGLLAIGHYFVDGAEDMLEELYGKYRLYLASNGIAKVQHSRIDSAGIEKYFDGMFISEEIGGRKPEPEYFQRCFERIPDFCKTHTAILGDSLSADMQGGKNAGITTIWFNRDDMPDEEDVRPDYEIRSLYELPPLMKRI